MKLKNSRLNEARRASLSYQANSKEERQKISDDIKKDSKKKQKWCRPWSEWTMTNQIMLTLLGLFAIYIPLQVVLLDVASRQYRQMLADEITINFNNLKDTQFNRLKADSLASKTKSFLSVRQQLMQKTGNIMSEILATNQNEYAVSWQGSQYDGLTVD